jgi:hypothetical protein
MSAHVPAQDLRNPAEGFEGGPTTSVIQPGSSVATALSEGESVRKHVALLEVGRGFGMGGGQERQAAMRGLGS